MSVSEQLTENEMLLEMLDIAAGAMIENDLCVYCAASGIGDCFFVKDSDICKNKMFEGLKIIAHRNLRDKHNETNRDDSA